MAMILVVFESYVLTDRVAYGGTTDVPSLDFGATLDPSISITVSGGSNQYGKLTFFSGNSMDFGKVTFTRPDQISNGDAYLKAGRLMLETVINTEVVFNSITAVNLYVSKMRVSANPFNETYVTLSQDRSAIPDKIFEEPLSNKIIQLSSPSTVTFLLLLEISPQQTGRVSDYFKLTAQPI